MIIFSFDIILGPGRHAKLDLAGLNPLGGSCFVPQAWISARWRGVDTPRGPTGPCLPLLTSADDLFQTRGAALTWRVRL